MPTEYRTIRISDKTYERLLGIREKLIAKGEASTVEGASITRDKVIAAALEALSREIEFTGKIQSEEDFTDDENEF
jgi:hypothetical protein